MATIFIRNLNYAYNRQIIFNNLNLKLKTGEFVVILGRSGTGKSTLLYLIDKDIKMQKGSIEFSEKLSISLVFQSPTFLKGMTVRQNVSLPLVSNGIDKKIINKKVNTILKKIEIYELAERNIDELSGGQLARVQIARALVLDPDVLLLDEPTGSIDEENAKNFISLFKELSKEKIVIMVTHRERLAFDYGDKVYLLHQGKLELKKDQKLKNANNYIISKKVEKRVLLSDALNIGWLFMKNKKGRCFCSIFFLTLIFSFLGLFLNVIMNVEGIFQNSAKTFYNYNVCQVSKVENIALGENMSLTKKTYPSKLQNNYHLSISLDYILGNTIRILNNEKTEYYEVSFEPVFSKFEKEIAVGRNVRNDNEVIVNSCLANELNMTKESLLGKEIELNKAIQVISEKDENKCLDSLSFDRTLIVVGVVDEILGLNSSRVYYSYENFYRQLSRYNLINASELYGTKISIIDRIELAPIDDVIKCYKALIEINDPSELKRMIGKDYEVESSALSYIENSSSVVKSFASIMEIFLILIAIGAFLLEFFTIGTIYEEHKKTLALFKTFHLSRYNFEVISYSLSAIYSFISILVYFLLNIIEIKIGNIFLRSYGFDNPLKFNFLNLENLILPIILILLALLASSFILYSLERKNLVLSLAEEVC